MKIEFRILREITFFITNAFVMTFIFDLLNQKNTAIVIAGLIGLASVFLLDCIYFRKFIVPTVKSMSTEIQNYDISK